MTSILRAESFVAGLCVGVAAATVVLWLSYRLSLNNPKTSSTVVTSDTPQVPPRSPQPECGTSIGLDDVIIAEQLTRNVQFFGLEAVKGLWSSHVVVVGLGGVGSHAAHMLLRSGVGRLTLIDFDQVTVSSLNRHSVATRADVGLPKARVLADHFRDIMPEARVEAHTLMFTERSEETILGGNPDFVLDAIDNLDTKVSISLRYASLWNYGSDDAGAQVALVAACKRRRLPVLCVGAAGAKADPTKLRFVDILEASLDPLLRAVRHRLRASHGIGSGVDVLLSMERPRCGLVQSESQARAPSMLDYQTIPNFRIRTIPVLGSSPALFGMAAASWILCKMVGAPILPEPLFTVHRGQYETLLEGLCEAEEARCGHCEDVVVDIDEVAFVVSHVWRGLSAFDLGIAEAGRDKGLHRRTAGLKLVRYDVARPCVPGNIVLLRDEEAADFLRLGLSKWKLANRDVASHVEQELARVDAIFGVLT